MIHTPTLTSTPFYIVNVKVHDPEGGTNSVGEISVLSDKDSFYHLSCHCSTYLRTHWCMHVRNMYQGYDVTDMFTPAQAIVVFSKKPWLIVPVIVVPETENLHRVDVLWGDPQRTGPVTYSCKGRETVGYLDDLAHHRRDIRRMLLEWLPAVPDMYPDSMSCNETYHVPKFSYIEKRGDIVYGSENPADLDLMKKVYTDTFNRLDVGKCLFCSSNEMMED